MDYSLLVGQVKIELKELKETCEKNPELGRGIYIDSSDRAWLIGIIDPLNSWTAVKKAEYFIKSIGYGRTVSAVPPDLYQKRFADLTIEIFSQKGITKPKLTDQFQTKDNHSYSSLVTAVPCWHLAYTLNILCPGFGTVYSSMYGRNGFNMATWLTGITQGLLFNCILFMTISSETVKATFVNVLCLIFVYAWIMLHSYGIKLLSKDKKKYGVTKYLI